MLLEVLSDFQISIPELGVVEATTRPLVLLTSNNTRELTEALKRRCLYLWLDYPDAERELEIVRLHVPELPETITRRLIEIVHMVRNLDLKKPPSIAESIDWARAMMLLGATDIDRSLFERTMSIIVKHRTDLDVVAERVGVKLDDGVLGQAEARVTRGRGGLYGGLPEGVAAGARPPARALLRGAARGGREGRHRRAARRVRRAGRGELDRARGLPRDARRDARQVPGGPARVRAGVRPLLLPRRRGAGGREGPQGDALRGRRADRPRRPAAADPGRDPAGQRRRDERPRAARGGRLRRPGRELGRDRRRRAADPPHARPAPARAATASQDGEGLDRDNLRRFEAHLRRELERAPDPPHREPAAVQAAGRVRPRAAGRPAPGPGAGPPRGGTAEAPPGDLAATRRAAGAAARSWTCAARCARRSRPAACRCGCATGPSARGGPRSTCCATSPRRSRARASSSCRSCTRSTTRSASCAASPSSSGSTR